MRHPLSTSAVLIAVAAPSKYRSIPDAEAYFAQPKQSAGQLVAQAEAQRATAHSFAALVADAGASPGPS